jgi:hypothetical protein
MSRSQDALGPLVLNLAGFGLLIAAWVAVSGRTTLSAQFPFINLAVAGLLLAGVGNALFIMGQRRLVDERLQRVHDGIERLAR